MKGICLAEWILTSASFSAISPDLPPAERCHTLPHLYRSTRPNTVNSCLGWCRPKLSCVAATWSWCKPSFKLPARSKKPARRPSLTCAGTAPPLTSPWTLESIVRTWTEVWPLHFLLAKRNVLLWSSNWLNTLPTAVSYCLHVISNGLLAVNVMRLKMNK